MNTTLIQTLLTSGLKNWKTTLTGLTIAILTVWQGGGFDQLGGKQLAVAIGMAALGFFSRDANKSSEDSGVTAPAGGGASALAQQLSSSLLRTDSGSPAAGAASAPTAQLRLLLCLLLPLFLLTNCATKADGTKTFLGLDGAQWGSVGKAGLQGAVGSALPEYGKQKEGADAGDKAVWVVAP